MSNNKVRIEKVKCGYETNNWLWFVDNGDDNLAASCKTYPSRAACLAGFFAILFGVFDNDNLAGLYAEWQANAPKEPALNVRGPDLDGVL